MRRVALVLLLALLGCSVTPQESGSTEPVAAAHSVGADASAAETADAVPTPDALPPLFAEPPPVEPLLEAEELRLGNGLRVLLRHDDEVPLVSVLVRVGGGALTDPAGKAGRAALLADLLTRGAGHRTAQAFREEVEFVGGRLDAWAGVSELGLEAEFLSRDLDLAMELVGDVLRRPRLDAVEFDRAHGLRTDRIRAARDEPSQVIDTYLHRFLLPGDLGRPVGGDEASLARLTREDVRAAAGELLQPAWTTVAVAGDFDRERVLAALGRHLGPWRSDGASVDRPRPQVTPVAGPPRVLVVDKPDALQTYFRAAGPGLHRGDPDHAARFVANAILGGRFTSRLNTALRIESGLSYGAYSGFDDARDGLFALRSFTATATSRDAVLLARDVYADFRANGLRDGELESAQSYVLGQYPLDELETAAQRMALRLDLERDGLATDVVDGLFRAIHGLDRATVERVIRERFPAELDWVLVGRGDVLEEFAADLGVVVRVPLVAPGFGPAPGR